jgi:type III secretory pathway component EscS
MSEYLLTNALYLFIKIVSPVIAGVLVGGAVAGWLKLLLHVEERSFGFAGRFIGGLFGVYLTYRLSSSTLVRYAERIWGGLDLYK